MPGVRVRVQAGGVDPAAVRGVDDPGGEQRRALSPGGRGPGIDVVVERAAFADNARGAIIGDREGMTKLLFDRATRQLIGVHCVGERASELVHVGHALLGGTVETLIEMVFNYPTLSETYKYAAYAALAELGAAPEP